MAFLNNKDFSISQRLKSSSQKHAEDVRSLRLVRRDSSTERGRELFAVSVVLLGGLLCVFCFQV